jgi:hypothetical protein
LEHYGLDNSSVYLSSIFPIIGVVYSFYLTINVEGGILPASIMFLLSISVLKHILSIYAMIIVFDKYNMGFVSMFRQEKIYILNIIRIKKVSNSKLSSYLCIYYKNTNNKRKKLKAFYDICKFEKLINLLLMTNPNIILKNIYLK